MRGWWVEGKMYWKWTRGKKSEGMKNLDVEEEKGGGMWREEKLPAGFNKVKER